MRVLIVEDEPEVADFLVRALREASWASDVAPTGKKALEQLSATEYDLVVMDLGLPDLDGLEACRAYRARGGKTPVLVLTARASLGDRVVGLDAGADDYLTKPFAVEELMARLRALARRPPVPLAAKLAVGDLELDPATHVVRRAGVPLRLTNREFALLEYLMRHPRRVVSRGQILDHVWNDGFDPVGNVVDVLIGRLRRRVDRADLVPLIHTVRGAGYVLTDEAPPSGA